MLFLKFVVLLLYSLQVNALEGLNWEVPERLSASFIQKRYLKSSNITLTSSGDFSYSKQDGTIIWKQKQPFENTIIISKDKIIESGVEREITSGLDISSLIYAFFEGKTDQMKVLFKVTKKDKNSYLLVPEKEQMRKVISQIEIKGEKHLEQVEMYESSGNFFKIDFKDVKADK